MHQYICIHGHFYQPPRENPWLNEVELQDSAYPYHDWNHRITAECYARNSASRILDHQDRIVDIVNNYSRISFNFGPTLLEWMEKEAHEVYEAILDADKKSMNLFNGHGSAIAQVYNHVIMPLANERDKQTQVIWGIRDFEARFNRKPKGMWCGETAVDTDTLEVLAEHGIEFTILSPYQAQSVRKIGDQRWEDARGARLDTKKAYKCNLPSGRSISIFYYDAPISQGIAFEGLLNNGIGFANRMIGALDGNNHPQLLNIATDGETYGHHHRYGEMGLSYCLHHIEVNKLAKLTIYAEFLEKFPPQYETRIIENSSWSCAHGVERWRSDCGCHTGGNYGWNQKWREPLRKAFDWLRDTLIPIFETDLQEFAEDPWQVRNDYIYVLRNRSEENVENFIRTHAKRELTENEKVKMLKLLEMQYHTLLMYTSCGWFFDEITGIESIQDIFYAARAIQLAKEITGKDFEPLFLELLHYVPSNVEEYGNAANAYDKVVRPAILDLMRVGAHFAVSSIFNKDPDKIKLYSYTAKTDHYENYKAGNHTLAIGKILLQSDVTWEKNEVSFAVLHLSDHNLFGGIGEYLDPESFEMMRKEIYSTFRKGNVHGIIVLMDKHFGTHNYSFWHLFKDDQKKILDDVLEYNNIGVEGLFRQIYDNNYPIMQAIKELNMPLPKPLKIPVDFIINSKLEKIIKAHPIDIKELSATIEESQRLSADIDDLTLSFIVAERLNEIIILFSHALKDFTHLNMAINLLEEVKKLSIKIDPWEAQNIVFYMCKRYFPHFYQYKQQGDLQAELWCKLFSTLCENLNVGIDKMKIDLALQMNEKS
jgi:alpha-amylase/alpha-mannosidase (GH57 family)